MRQDRRLLIISAIFLTLFSMSGCTSAYYREMIKASADHTQCKPDDLVIVDDTGTIVGGGIHRWKVECPGKKYQCTGTSMKSIECHSIPD
jgi:hypothetical protein